MSSNPRRTLPLLSPVGSSLEYPEVESLFALGEDQQLSPPTARVVPRVETMHGETRVDNYFWLRDRADPEVLAYLEAENRYALAAMRHTEALQERLYQEM